MQFPFARVGFARHIALLEAFVQRQFCFVQRQVAAHFFGQSRRADGRFSADAHHQRIALGTGIFAFRDPAPQLLGAGGQHAVGAFAATASLGGQGLDPAGLLQARQFAVNLLVGGGPEKTDRFIEAPRQLRAGTSFL